MKYDLEKRTKNLAINTIRLVSTIKPSLVNKNILEQLLRSVSSVGANYVEANGAESKKDFAHKIFVSRKEIQETEYWLTLLSKLNEDNKENMELLLDEAHQLVLIFNKITYSLKN